MQVRHLKLSALPEHLTSMRPISPRTFFNADNCITCHMSWASRLLTKIITLSLIAILSRSALYSLSPHGFINAMSFWRWQLAARSWQSCPSWAERECIQCRIMSRYCHWVSWPGIHLLVFWLANKRGRIYSTVQCNVIVYNTVSMWHDNYRVVSRTDSLSLLNRDTLQYTKLYSVSYCTVQWYESTWIAMRHHTVDSHDWVCIPYRTLYDTDSICVCIGRWGCIYFKRRVGEN